MNGLSLDKILSDLREVSAPPSTDTKKTAAVSEKQENSKSAQAKTELLEALKRAESASTKTASAKETKSNPVADLEKTAADLAAADQEALVKEAQFYGAAIADGFMARLQQFEKAAESLPAPEKTAQSAPVDVQKVAEEAIRGYVETQSAIKQAAEKEYVRGYNDTIKEVEKIATDVFAQGAEDCRSVLQQAAA